MQMLIFNSLATISTLPSLGTGRSGAYFLMLAQSLAFILDP